MPACPAGHDSSATDFCDTCGMRIGGAAATGPGTASSGAAFPASAGLAPAGGGGLAGGAGGQAPAAGEACPQCGTERSGQFCEVCGFDFNSGTPTQFAAASGTATGLTGGAPSTAAGAALTGNSLASGPSGTGPATTGGPAGSMPAASTGMGLPVGPPSAASATPASVTGQAPVTTPLSVATGPPLGGAAGTTWTAIAAADRAYYDSVIEAGGPDAASIQFPGYCPERRFPLAGRELRIGRKSASRGLEPEIDLTGPPADPGISHLHAVLIAQPDGTWSVLDPGSSNGTQVNGIEIAEGVPVPLKDGDRINLGAWTALTVHAE